MSEDDEIIHLMTRMAESSTNAGASSTTSTTGGTTQQTGGTIQQNVNANPFGNLLGNLLGNPNNMIQMTSMFLGGEGGRGTGNLNNLFSGVQNAHDGSQSSNQTTNDINSLLQNILNPRNTQTSQTSQQNANTSNQQSTTDTNPITAQYPLLRTTNDHLTNFERILNTVSGNQESNIPNAPNLNYPLNVLTAVGTTLRRYTQDLTRFLPYLTTLSDCLERESLITNSEDREKVKRLVINIQQGIDELTKSTTPLQPILHGLDYGNAPGTGSLRLVATTELQMSVGPNLGNQSGGNETTINQNHPNQNIQNQQTTPISSQIPQTVQNTQSAQGTTQGTNQGTNPFQQIISEMQQPGNMQMMMNMVGNLFGGGSQSGGSAGEVNINNLLGQLMGNLNAGDETVPEVPQNTLDYLNNILNDNQLRKSTYIHSIPENILKIEPQADFAPFVKEIVSQLTFQEVVDLKSINFRCFTRLRKLCREKLSNYINSKLAGDKSKCIELFTDILSERLIIAENETDKLSNTNFSVDVHLKKFIQIVVDLILDESSNDLEFESTLRSEFLLFIGDLFYDLVNSYVTGKEGAFYYFDCNLEDLVNALIGQSALDVLFSVDDNFLGKLGEFSDNMIDLYDSTKSQLLEERANRKSANKVYDKIYFHLRTWRSI